MNFLENDLGSLRSSSSLEDDDALIWNLLIAHDPDGRHFDCDSLLRAVENVMFYATSSEVMVSDMHFDVTQDNSIDNFDAVGFRESLGKTIYKLSRERLCKRSGDGDLHAKAMILLDLLANYRWGSKLVILLAAFASSYGEFWLILQQCPRNPLAVSVALLKQLPADLRTLKPQFKVLSLLVKTMVGITKYIIQFDGLPITHVKLDGETVASTKSNIYKAVYWVTRSVLICSFQITDLIGMKHEYSNSTVITVWELSSLVYRLSRICSCLRRQVNECQEQIEIKMHQKLLNLFKETHVDNQEVLRVFFELKNDLPLKDCSSQDKLGVAKLKNKIVLLLFSKLELEILPLEKLLLLVQQTYDHPENKNLKESYEIVWVPIPFSDAWNDTENKSFNLLSNSLPWLSIRQPWLLSSVVLKYVKQEWNYRDETAIVVLDSNGMVTNLNAIDMMLIWGVRAYPFSNSREEELWEKENWTLQFIVNEIDPLLTYWVEEGRYVCIYGSENLEWIRDISRGMKEIRSESMKLEFIYVGNRNPNEQMKHILATIDEEKLSNSLSIMKIHFFWLRLESMRRSKLQLGKTRSTDKILRELTELLDYEDKDTGWAIIGKGSLTDMIKLQGNKLMECLNQYSNWGENVAKLGFLDAVRTALEPPSMAGPCYHTKLIPYVEGVTEGTSICDKCKKPMKKLFVFE